MSILPPTSPQVRAVTVSIVSHGHLGMVADLLAQLEQHSAAVIDRIILTLNIPEPATPLPATGLPLQVLHNAQPQGFGANHNQAFTHCRSPWFLVLNPDITLNDDVLSTLLAQAAANDGLLAPDVIEPGHPGPVPERRPPSPWEILRRHLGRPLAAQRTTWVAGLFMLVRRDAYAAVGGFDEKFHMYAEDFDLCARLQLAGWQVRRIPGPSIHHAAQRASHGNLRHLAWHLGSLLRLWLSPVWWRYRRHLGKPYCRP